MKRVMVALGSRSEMIKLAPVVQVLREKHQHQLRLRTVQTDQSDEQTWQSVSLFGLVPDQHLRIDPTALPDVLRFSREITKAIGQEIDKTRPELVVINGDSLLSVLSAQQAFLRRIPIVHIEAGVRSYESTYDNQVESHRRMLSAMANFHCVSNAHAANNLRSEGFPVYEIGITGNPIVDALAMINRAGALDGPATVFPRPPSLHHAKILVALGRHDGATNRFSNLELAFAIANLAHDHPGLEFSIAPTPTLALNGNVRSILGAVKNVQLLERLSYLEFVQEIKRTDLVLTDCGDIQDEAITLGKPILVMQDAADRPELIRTGGGKLVGTSQEEIIDGVREALANTDDYQKMRAAPNPFGDGRASQRIGQLIANWSRNRVLTPHSFEPFVFDQTRQGPIPKKYH